MLLLSSSSLPKVVFFATCGGNGQVDSGSTASARIPKAAASAATRSPIAPNVSILAASVSGISKFHRNGMLNRWPDLKETAFAHSWGVTLAFTWNGSTIFVECAPGLFAVLTNDVSPMTRSAAAGRLLADFMEGEDGDLLSLQLGIPGASRLPPRPILDIGIAIRRGLLHAAAHKEF